MPTAYQAPPSLCFPPGLRELAQSLTDGHYLYLTFTPYHGGRPGARRRGRLDFTPDLVEDPTPALLSLGASNGWTGWGTLNAIVRTKASADPSTRAGENQNSGTWWMYFDRPDEPEPEKPKPEDDTPDFMELWGMFQQVKDFMGGPMAGGPSPTPNGGPSGTPNAGGSEGNLEW